jgi:hypothetical protein
LTYISQRFGLSYPEWTSSVEDDIRNNTLTNRYYARLPSAADELVEAEKDRQQKRLDEALNLHTRIQQTISRIRQDVIACAIFLIMPLLLSLLLLMVSDFMSVFWAFVLVAFVVLLAAVGIMLLIKMVLESTVKPS